MDKIVIAVGSLRRPKLEAVREAMAAIAPKVRPGAGFEVVGVETPSGVRHTPLSREEIMAGARQRAEALAAISRAEDKGWHYFAGLEGGVDILSEGGKRWVFLESWAYIIDGRGRASFGQSGAIPLPDALAKRVVDEGVELSEAIDEFAGGQGIRDGQGAWGVLTRGIMNRQDAFRVAVINAFPYPDP